MDQANQPASALHGTPLQIVGYVYFTFISYLSIGLPLAVIPTVVHFRMGYAAWVAGLVISIQSVATLVSRPWAGRIGDHVGAKVAVQWGMAACTLSGALVAMAGVLAARPAVSLSVLIASRLALGVGESLGSTGSTIWGISALGYENTARVISYNGISTYGAQAIGAPIGVLIAARWGLGGIGAAIVLLGTVSMVLASRKAAVPVTAGEHLPLGHLLLRVAPHGMALALGGVGYGTLAAFVTLFYASRHWAGAALCLTAFGLAFIAARIFFLNTIYRYGGFAVSLASLAVESVGLAVLWQARGPAMALAAAATAGFGFSLVFPALGVEAVKRVPEHNRGTALGLYTAFVDVSFFVVGPVAGLVIGGFGYSSAFLFAFIAILLALGIVLSLRAANGR